MKLYSKTNCKKLLVLRQIPINFKVKCAISLILYINSQMGRFFVLSTHRSNKAFFSFGSTTQFVIKPFSTGQSKF